MIVETILGSKGELVNMDEVRMTQAGLVTIFGGMLMAVYQPLMDLVGTTGLEDIPSWLWLSSGVILLVGIALLSSKFSVEGNSLAAACALFGGPLPFLLERFGLEATVVFTTCAFGLVGLIFMVWLVVLSEDEN